MKEYASKFLKAVAIFYMGFPVFYILCSALLFDVPASALIRILLSPSYYLLSILAILAGYGLWVVRHWAWYLFGFVQFLVAYQNAVIVNEYGTTHYKLLSFLASLVILGMIAFRVSREIRVPYFFPKIRWWESNPRYKLSVSVKVTRADGTLVDGHIMDLSMGGCFIKSSIEMNQHENLQLNFSAFKLPIECRGVIVWRTQSTVTTPKGVGVKFMPLERAQKRNLRQIYYRLKRIALFYRRARYLLNQDEFLKRLNELEAEMCLPRPPRRKRLIG